MSCNCSYICESCVDSRRSFKLNIRVVPYDECEWCNAGNDDDTDDDDTEDDE